MTKVTSNPNRNCLDGIACPRCLDFGPFSIFAIQAGMVRVSDVGTDFIDGNIEWEATSRCECLACGHAATVGEFRGEGPAAFDECQKLVIEVYDNGEFAHLSPEDVSGCGDSLLKFLLSELSTREDCDSAETALARLETAKQQLSDIRAALEAHFG
jgi:hypothetical protein